MDYKVPLLAYAVERPTKKTEEAEPTKHQGKEKGRDVNPTPSSHIGKGKILKPLMQGPSMNHPQRNSNQR